MESWLRQCLFAAVVIKFNEIVSISVNLLWKQIKLHEMRIKAFSFHLSPHFTPGTQVQPYSSRNSNNRGKGTTIGGAHTHPFHTKYLFCYFARLVYIGAAFCLLSDCQLKRLSIWRQFSVFTRATSIFQNNISIPTPIVYFSLAACPVFLFIFPFSSMAHLYPFVQYIDSNRNRILRQRVHKKFIVIIIIERNLFESNKQETIHHRCLD